MLHNDPVDMTAVESHVKKMELRTSVILDGVKAAGDKIKIDA